MSTIVNLYGGPGTGKSTTMAAIFAELKKRGASVEMAPEWVKVPVWAGEIHVLEDQLYIFAKQNRILRRLVGNVDFVITDSPLLMSLVYSADPLLHALVRDVSYGYDNMHVFLSRVKPYDPAGRIQDETKARDLDREIRNMLRQESVIFCAVEANDRAGSFIADSLA